jgi:hypothetical protein
MPLSNDLDRRKMSPLPLMAILHAVAGTLPDGEPVPIIHPGGDSPGEHYLVQACPR